MRVINELLEHSNVMRTLTDPSKINNAKDMLWISIRVCVSV